jgi:hypothetical protein
MTQRVNIAVSQGFTTNSWLLFDLDEWSHAFPLPILVFDRIHWHFITWQTQQSSSFLSWWTYVVAVTRLVKHNFLAVTICLLPIPHMLATCQGCSSSNANSTTLLIFFCSLFFLPVFFSSFLLLERSYSWFWTNEVSGRSLSGCILLFHVRSICSWGCVHIYYIHQHDVTMPLNLSL